MGKKFLVACLVVSMVFSFTGCTEEVVEELPLAKEIVDSAIESSHNLKTYQFDTDATIAMTSNATDSEISEMTMVMHSVSLFDIENQQMQAEMSANVSVPGELEMEMDLAYYVLDDTLYLMMAAPILGTQWMKSEIPETGVPEEFWEQMNEITTQMKLLETSTVEVLGTEKVNNVDCYILKLNPDLKQLWQWAMEQANQTGQGIPGDVEAEMESFAEILQKIFNNASIKQWIAKDSHYLARAEINLDMELSPETMGFPEEEGGITLDINMILMAYNYNQPVSIILPPEAKEAEEISLNEY
jgi:hypothetical protein